MYQLLYEENVVDPDTSKTYPFRYESFTRGCRNGKHGD